MKTSKTVNPHRNTAGFGAVIHRLESLRFPSALASLFVLAIGGTLLLSGCPSPTGGGDGRGGIDFRVESVTPSGRNTESLTITFESEINTLTQSDIDLSLSPEGGVTWGLPMGGGKDWSLIITFPETSYAGDYNCAVRIGKPGISATARNVTVQNNEGKINFSLTAEVESDGTGVLNIAFSRDTSLEIKDIMITPTGSSPGSAEIPAAAKLSGSGREYSVPISKVRDGSVAVTISGNSSVTSDGHSPVTTEARTVELKVGESTGPGPQITSLAIVDIKGEPFTNEKAEVEIDLTLQLYIKTIPMSAKDKARIAWSSNAESKATVSSKGLVTGVDETGTGSNVIITATSIDSPGVHAYLTLTVKPHTKPTGLNIYDGTLGDGGNYENIIVAENSGPGSDYKLELELGGKSVTFITVLNDASKPTADQEIFMEYSSGGNSYFEISAPRDRSDGERGKQYTITPKAEGTAIITFTADFYPEVRKTLEVVVK